MSDQREGQSRPVRRAGGLPSRCVLRFRMGAASASRGDGAARVGRTPGGSSRRSCRVPARSLLLTRALPGGDALRGLSQWPHVRASGRLAKSWVPAGAAPFWPDHGRGSEALQIGVLYADGRKARSTAPYPEGDPSPTRPVLIARGGGGSKRSWRQDYWVWPEIPEGDLDVVIEWPARAIVETHASLAARPIAEARERIVVLWPDR